MNKGRWIVADDHPAFRFGVRLWLERGGMSVVGEVATIDALQQLVQSVEADGVVLDVTFPDGDAIEAIPDLVASQPKIRILVVSSHDDAFTIQRARRAGAHGILAKEVDPGVLVEAARMILERGSLDSVTGRSANTELSPRELQVVALVARGATNPQIAHTLDVSAETVKSYLQSAFSKLGVSDRTSAAVRARELHLIS